MIPEQINVCPNCLQRIRGRVCSCGCPRSIRMSRMTHVVMLALEEADAPINMVTCSDYQDAEFMRAAGVI